MWRFLQMRRLKKKIRFVFFQDGLSNAQEVSVVLEDFTDQTRVCTSSDKIPCVCRKNGTIFLNKNT